MTVIPDLGSLSNGCAALARRSQVAGRLPTWFSLSRYEEDPKKGAVPERQGRRTPAKIGDYLK